MLESIRIKNRDFTKVSNSLAKLISTVNQTNSNVTALSQAQHRHQEETSVLLQGLSSDLARVEREKGDLQVQVAKLSQEVTELKNSISNHRCLSARHEARFASNDTNLDNTHPNHELVPHNGGGSNQILVPGSFLGRD